MIWIRTIGKERATKATVGDWLVLKGTTVGQADRRGLITEVRSPDGSPPYVVRWLDTGHHTTVFPGPDAALVTAAEQQAADKRAQARAESAQAAAVSPHAASRRGK